jgi:hypothetical protein
LAGEASGHDCTIMSSGVSGSQSSIVRWRASRNLLASEVCRIGKVVALKVHLP